MSDPSLGRSKEVRNALLKHLRALKVAGVEGVAIGGGEGGGLVLVVDVNNRYRGGVPTRFEGYPVETYHIGSASNRSVG
jgi:hypothetical protein